MENCDWPGRSEALRKRPDGSYANAPDWVARRIAQLEGEEEWSEARPAPPTPAIRKQPDERKIVGGSTNKEDFEWSNAHHYAQAYVRMAEDSGRSESELCCVAVCGVAVRGSADDLVEIGRLVKVGDMYYAPESAPKPEPLARGDTKQPDERTLAEILESAENKVRLCAKSLERATKALENFKKAYDDLDKLGE